MCYYVRYVRAAKYAGRLADLHIKVIRCRSTLALRQYRTNRNEIERPTENKLVLWSFFSRVAPQRNGWISLSIDFYGLSNRNTFFFNPLTGEDKLICLTRGSLAS